MKPLRVLVVGGGAREHALAWRLSTCPSVGEVWAAPGNPGMAAVARLVGEGGADGAAGLGGGGLASGSAGAGLGGGALVAWAVDAGADLVVIGPEAPLVEGLADRMRARGLAVLGPSAAAAAIEGSKGWAKDFCLRHGVPVAAGRSFDDPEEAAAYAAAQQLPVVVKADGLMAGKGVTVAPTTDEAAMAARTLGRRGRVVVEEWLQGRELSAFALVDGREFVPLAMARDHKRLVDGDRGPNTGGMGAYSPVPDAGPAVVERVAREVFAPVVAGLAAEGRPYVGVLYAGLMLTADGPRVLEFNARFGDPEAQVLLPRWDGDVALNLLAAARGELRGVRPAWRPEAAVGVVLASPGYPDAPAPGRPIAGLDERGGLAAGVERAARAPGGGVAADAGAAPGGGAAVRIFHAATRRTAQGWYTAGGRVLTVVGLGADLRAARAEAYRGAATVSWAGMRLRHDIGDGAEH